jgi:hypothetical protein
MKVSEVYTYVYVEESKDRASGAAELTVGCDSSRDFIQRCRQQQEPRILEFFHVHADITDVVADACRKASAEQVRTGELRAKVLGLRDAYLMSIANKATALKTMSAESGQLS